ncbi:MAG: tyrosine-type recombinase/integrase [bacterium]
MTLMTATRRFLTQLEADGKSPLTISVYRRELTRFARWLGATTDVRRVRPDALARYLTDPALLVTPSGERRSARAMNRTRTVLRLLFGYLTLARTLRHDPSRLLKNARADRPLASPMTEVEERRFVRTLDRGAKSAQGRRDRALFTLLLRSGMRLAAALALDVEDLDLRTGTARSVGKHVHVQDVVLPRDVTRTLRRYLVEEEIREGALFRSSRGRLSSRQAQYRFHALLAAAGIERPLTVHSLRHTFATRLRERTGDLRIVQAALGHRHLGTTEAYARASSADVRQAVGDL